jgi:hypothetical protein
VSVMLSITAQSVSDKSADSRRCTAERFREIAASWHLAKWIRLRSRQKLVRRQNFLAAYFNTNTVASHRFIIGTGVDIIGFRDSELR